MAEALRSRVRLASWERVPAPSAVAASELVIIDLTVPCGAVQPQTVTALLDHVEVWLVVGTKPVDPGWVDRARHARVRVLSVGSCTSSSYDGVITALLERYTGPICGVDSERLLVVEPALTPLRPYVRLLCDHPWLVRHPRDLADLAHVSLRALKLDCQALGFTRIEHFIIYVRAIAYEQLMGRGLSARDARRISGLTDPSNMRRHFRRALRRSPHALAHHAIG